MISPFTQGPENSPSPPPFAAPPWIARVRVPELLRLGSRVVGAATLPGYKGVVGGRLTGDGAGRDGGGGRAAGVLPAGSFGDGNRQVQDGAMEGSPSWRRRELLAVVLEGGGGGAGTAIESAGGRGAQLVSRMRTE